jgi:predicted enzyme related to lactoylglutathione lyase
MTATMLALSVDCADARRLAEFWAAVLGRTVNDGASADFASVAADDQAKSGPFLMFHKVPEPKTIKNRVHLDLISTEYSSETERLLGLGATRVRDVVSGDSRWTTLADPEGNEFDLVAG